MEPDVIETVKDPVCEMDVEPEKAAATRKRGGRTYWFCSQVCAETFDEDPQRYADAAERGR